MNPSQCEEAQAVLKAVSSGRWPEPSSDLLRVHARNCPICSDVVLVSEFLKEMAESPGSGASLPDPAWVWWRSQRLKERDATRRATLPIRIAEKLAFSCGAATLGAIMIWQLPRFKELFSHLDIWGILHSFLSVWNQPLNWLLLCGASAYLLLLAILLTQVWTED